MEYSRLVGARCKGGVCKHSLMAKVIVKHSSV
jgi:hypothetical protein